MQKEIEQFTQFVEENGGPVFAGEKAFNAIAEHYGVGTVNNSRAHVGNVTIIRHSILPTDEIMCMSKEVHVKMNLDFGE